MSLSPSLTQSSPVRRGRAAVIALWSLQIGLAALVGAVLAQLFVVKDSAVPPAILLLGAVLVVWTRRHELPFGHKGR